jgi:hypothetical protein
MLTFVLNGKCVNGYICNRNFLMVASIAEHSRIWEFLRKDNYYRNFLYKSPLMRGSKTFSSSDQPVDS